MASVFKPKGSDRYVIQYFDETGTRRKRAGTRDKAVTQRIANKLEEEVALRIAGLVDPKEEAYAKHAATPLDQHLTAWQKALTDKGAEPTYAERTHRRACVVAALVKDAKLDDIAVPHGARRRGSERFDEALAKVVETARLSDLTPETVQAALATLRKEGRSLTTGCDRDVRALVQEERPAAGRRAVRRRGVQRQGRSPA
jgi:hypothetical protein